MGALGATSRAARQHPGSRAALQRRKGFHAPRAPTIGARGGAGTFRRVPSCRYRSKRLVVSPAKRIALSLASAAAVLVAAELFLRRCRPVYFLDPEAPVGDGVPLVHRSSQVPGLAYELVPGATSELDGVSVRINSRGMRDAEPLPDDAPGLYRVAVLGDSIAFGWRVEQEQCFSDVLERELRERACASRPCEVLNFATTGYSTRDEVDLFLGRVDGYDPDLLILAYCMNDPARDVHQPLPRYFGDKPWYVRSHLVRMLLKSVHERRLERYGGSDYYRYAHATDGPEWPRVVAAFDDLRVRTEARGIPVLVVIFPWVREASWEQYPYADLHEQVAAEARAHGFRVLDLLSAFRAHPPADVVFGSSDPHPTALGHAVAAEEIARLLVPELLAQESVGARR